MARGVNGSLSLAIWIRKPSLIARFRERSKMAATVPVHTIEVGIERIFRLILVAMSSRGLIFRS
jgi:hypothetical protein